MGKGGPQPAHQVRPGDLQLEEPVLDLEDSEIFGHFIVPVGQLMSYYEVSSTEKSIGEVLDDEDDDYEPKDVDNETIEEHDRFCEGPSYGLVYNLNNNAKKSRKSARKDVSSVLHQVDILLQEIIYRDGESKRQPEEEEIERLVNSYESLNKTHNNRYLQSIKEEDTVSKEQTNENCQQRDIKNNNAESSIPAGESFQGAALKRRFHGCRRQVYCPWRGQVYDRPRQSVQFQQVNMCGDGSCDYGQLRKGMGDVMDETSELNNLAIMSGNDKAEINNEDREFQSPGKLSIGPSTLEEMDHTTAADFSSFLEPGSICLYAENASQTTLIDEVTLPSDTPPQKDQEKTAIPGEADIICHKSQDIVSPPSPRGVRFRDHLNTDTINTKLKDEKQSITSPGKIIADFPCTVEDKSHVQQNRSSDERSVNDLPECQIEIKDHISPGPILPSLTSSHVSTAANSINSKHRCTARITSKSQTVSLVKEYKYTNCPGSQVPPSSLKNYNSENVTHNHSSSQSLEDSSVTLQSQVNCGQDKSSKRRSIKRRKSRRILKSSTVEVEKSDKIKQDAWEDTVLSQHRQEVVGIGEHEMKNYSEIETEKPGAVQSLTTHVRSCTTKQDTFSVHDNAKSSTFSVHDNAKSNTFSVHSYSKPDTLSVHTDAKPDILPLCDNAKATTFSFLDNTTSSTFYVHDNAKPNDLSIHNDAKHTVISVYDNAKPNALSGYDNAKPNVLSVHGNAKPNVVSAHDNAKPTTFSIQCQTSHQNLTPSNAQFQISQSKASADNRGTAAADASPFTSMNMYTTASNRVLNKLLTSKRSQAPRDSIASCFYESKDVQAKMAAVHRKKRLSSHHLSPMSVRLPQITKLISACSNPYKDETAGEYDNIQVTQLKMTPDLYNSLHEDVFYHVNNKVPSNLARDVTNRFSVSTSVVSKTHISLQKQARSSLLLHSSRLSATQSSIVNANLNSTSSYATIKQQDQDEVTIRISSESTSASSKGTKIPTTSTNLTTKERNGGIVSYFGNSFFKSSVQNHDSSVDGDEYPMNKKIATSYAREQASQTHEDDIISVTSLRKGKGHHVQIIRDSRQGLVEEQGTQTNRIASMRNMNTISAPGNLSKRYNVEMPPVNTISAPGNLSKRYNVEMPPVNTISAPGNLIKRCNVEMPPVNTISAPGNLSERYNVEIPSPSTSRGRKTMLPTLQEQRHQEELKQAQENPTCVRSPSSKGYSFPQSDSLYARELVEDGNVNLDAEDKWYTNIPRHQDTKRVHSQRYAQEGWELKDTSITVRRNLENNQHLPSLNPENFGNDETTYRVSFQDPKTRKRTSNGLYPSPYDLECAQIRQKNSLLDSHHETDEAQYFEAEWPQKRSSDNQEPYRSVYASDTFEYALQNKLRDQDSNVIPELRADKKRKSVSFDDTQVQPLLKSLSDEPDLSSKFRRSRTLPPSYAYQDVNGVLDNFMRGYKPRHCPDRWGLHYTDSGYPTTMIERRKCSQPQLLPARLLADSYYDPSNNVINVVVKPVNVNLNKRLQNIQVKIYRSPPRLPPLTSVSKEGKEKARKRMYSSAPLPRNIINRRAANPPFNTTTTLEANERYHNMFDNWKIQ